MFEEIAKDAIEAQAKTARVLDHRHSEMVQALQSAWQAGKLDSSFRTSPVLWHLLLLG
jgi:hypothetical protein